MTNYLDSVTIFCWGQYSWKYAEQHKKELQRHISAIESGNESKIYTDNREDRLIPLSFNPLHIRLPSAEQRALAEQLFER